MEKLMRQIPTLLVEADLSDEERTLAAAIISQRPCPDGFSQGLIDSLSNFLAACDKIPSEIRESLQERLDLEMKKEREVILSLYPRPRQDSTGRWRARPYGNGNRKELVKNSEKEWDDAIIEYHKAQQIKAMTLETALERYNSDRDDISDNTKDHNIYDMKRFAGNLMQRPISSITALEIQREYVAAIKSTNAGKRACDNYKGILRRVFKHAKKHYGCETIDIDDCIDDLNTEVNKAIIKKPEQHMLFEYPTDRFTLDEILDFMAEVERMDTLRAFACLVPFYAGHRISEIGGIHKDDLSIEDHTIYVRHSAKLNRITKERSIGEPKKEKKRLVVFPEMAVPMFERVLELSDPDSPYLFSNTSKRRACDWLSDKVIDSTFRKIGRAIELREIKSAHDMRRTYDSILDEATMSSALRHLLLGHELTGIDANYLRDSHSLKEVQDTIDSAFENFFKGDALYDAKPLPKVS